MSILTRAKQIIFGDSGGTGEFGQIGSKAAGAPATTKDLTVMQSLTEYLQGLNAIVSDQGTSVLPYLEDMNSLFFLTTSQLAYLFQSGVPEWDTDTDYYEFVSIVQDEGLLWLSISGVDPTPNQGNKPSTNQDKWIPLGAGTKTSIVSATGSFTTEYRNHIITSDTSGGNNTITLDDGLFNGQEVEIFSSGSGITYVKGVGVLTNGRKSGIWDGSLTLGTVVSEGYSLKLKWNSNLSIWMVKVEITAKYIASSHDVEQWSNGAMDMLRSISVGGSASVTVPVAFTSVNYRITIGVNVNSARMSTYTITSTTQYNLFGFSDSGVGATVLITARLKGEY